MLTAELEVQIRRFELDDVSVWEFIPGKVIEKVSEAAKKEGIDSLVIPKGWYIQKFHGRYVGPSYFPPSGASEVIFSKGEEDLEEPKFTPFWLEINAYVWEAVGKPENDILQLDILKPEVIEDPADHWSHDFFRSSPER